MESAKINPKFLKGTIYLGLPTTGSNKINGIVRRSRSTYNMQIRTIIPETITPGKSEAVQLLRSCLIFGQNLRLKAKQPSCL